MEHEGRGRCVSFEMMHMMARDMTHERREDFLEGVERLCVCMCVCVFEDEADLEYEQGVGFATQLQILYMCSAVMHLSRTVKNLDRK